MTSPTRKSVSLGSPHICYVSDIGLFICLSDSVSLFVLPRKIQSKFYSNYIHALFELPSPLS